MSSKNIKEKVINFKQPCKKDLQAVIERLRGITQSTGAKTKVLGKKVSTISQSR